MFDNVWWNAIIKKIHGAALRRRLSVHIHSHGSDHLLSGSCQVVQCDVTISLWYHNGLYVQFMLCPSPTVQNLLPNVDECKKFEIRTHSSLSKGQMHKIIFFFSWAWLKVRKWYEHYSVLPSILHERTRMNRIE